MLWSIADALSLIVRQKGSAFTEHVMCIGARELYADAHARTHLVGRNSLKDIVRVKFKDRGKVA
jgi:hypothetical protein